MILGLLDTGARANEFLNLNLDDVELVRIPVKSSTDSGACRPVGSEATLVMA